MVVRTRRRRVDRGEIWYILIFSSDAGWSSPVARWAHNPKVAGSNPAPATKFIRGASPLGLPNTVTRSRWGARSVPVARSLRSLASLAGRFAARLRVVVPIDQPERFMQLPP